MVGLVEQELEQIRFKMTDIRPHSDERLEAEISTFPRDSLEAFVKGVRDSVETFSVGMPQTDDITILPGVTIGEGSIIGANSLVTDDIPPFSIAFGSPAKVIRQLTESEKEEVDKKYRS